MRKRLDPTRPATDPAVSEPEPGGRDVDPSRQVIARAAVLLRVLERAPDGLRIADLTLASELPRTTVTRLVAALESEQLVTVLNRSVRLGPALLRMAATVHLDVTARARPYIESLSRQLNETVDLWIERDTCVELVDEVVSTQEVRVAAPLGFRLPLHSTAPGKVFLAHRSDAEIVQRVGSRLAVQTPRTHTSMPALMADLEQIRRSRMAVDEEEHVSDVCALAMRVDLHPLERHAIAVPVPARRFQASRARLEEALRACHDRIQAGR